MAASPRSGALFGTLKDGARGAGTHGGRLRRLADCWPGGGVRSAAWSVLRWLREVFCICNKSIPAWKPIALSAANLSLQLYPLQHFRETSRVSGIAT